VIGSAVQVIAVPANTELLWIQLAPTVNIYLRKGIYEDTGLFGIGSQDYKYTWDTINNTLTIGQAGFTG
jgi:hypothetical protein